MRHNAMKRNAMKRDATKRDEGIVTSPPPSRAPWARRFARDERGTIALMFALMLPLLFGIVGLGLETGIWFKERRELQTIADAAAVSAAIENTYGATSSEILAAVTLEATANGYDPTTDAITWYSTPRASTTSAAYAENSAYIEVEVTRQLETILSQLLLSLNPSTTARAVAGTTSDQEACVLALASTGTGINLSGAGTSVTMAGCSVVANSTDETNAINVQNGTLTTECLSTPGNINVNGTLNTACTTPVTGAAAADDPFASLTVPTYSSSGCVTTPPASCLTGNGNNAYTPADGETLSEGVYQDGLNISAGSTVTMNPGTYIIDEGDFTVNGNATITGSDVTIILTSNSGGSYGSIQITGGGTVDLSAPTSEDLSGTITGDYTGILFFQDPSAPNNSSLNSTVSGGSEVELGGAIYLPNNDLSFSGGNTANSNGCLMLVAQAVTFNGTADIDNECDMYGGNPIVYGATPGLVE